MIPVPVIIIFAVTIIAVVVKLMFRSDKIDEMMPYLNELEAIYEKAKKGVSTPEEEARVSELTTAYLSCLRRGNFQSGIDRDKIQEISTFFATRRPSVTSMSLELEQLALLRKKGLISDHEFQAFSERFKLSPGHKSQEIIKAISDLYDQHKRGAMSEGNYHAGLWTLLDKLDRKV